MQEAQGEQPQPQQRQEQRQECSAAADRLHESNPSTEEAGTSAADGGGRGFAARRPGWQLPSLHEGLQLESDEVLTQFKGRQPCPKWCVQGGCQATPPAFFRLPCLPVGLECSHWFCTAAVWHIVSCVCCRSQRSRHLYCYDCLVSLTPTPQVPLPFKFSIITHSVSARWGAAQNTGRGSTQAQLQVHPPGPPVGTMGTAPCYGHSFNLCCDDLLCVPLRKRLPARTPVCMPPSCARV